MEKRGQRRGPEGVGAGRAQARALLSAGSRWGLGEGGAPGAS